MNDLVSAEKKALARMSSRRKSFPQVLRYMEGHGYFSITFGVNQLLIMMSDNESKDEHDLVLMTVNCHRDTFNNVYRLCRQMMAFRHSNLIRFYPKNSAREDARPIAGTSLQAGRVCQQYRHVLEGRVSHLNAATQQAARISQIPQQKQPYSDVCAPGPALPSPPPSFFLRCIGHSLRFLQRRRQVL